MLMKKTTSSLCLLAARCETSSKMLQAYFMGASSVLFVSAYGKFWQHKLLPEEKVWQGLLYICNAFL